MKEGHDGFCVRSASLGCGTMSVESVGFHIYLIIKKKKPLAGVLSSQG